MQLDIAEHIAVVHTRRGCFSGKVFLYRGTKRASRSMHISGQKDAPFLARRCALLTMTDSKVP